MNDAAVEHPGDVGGAAIQVWGFELPEHWLNAEERAYLQALPKELPPVEWVWAEMDRVWRLFGMDNRKPLAQQRVGDFYSHPVWLMNGIFTHVDPVSGNHREAIARYVAQLGANKVADYGGGFGELALAFSQHFPAADVRIVEPFPTRAGMERVRDVERIGFVANADPDAYDVVSAEDVLEHVEDPVGLAHTLASAVHVGGHVIYANCFYPVIQCHIPSTFHLRYTFPWVMRRMGLVFVGHVPGASHALVFRRQGGLDLPAARRAERWSRMFGPALNGTRGLLGRAKRAVLR